MSLPLPLRDFNALQTRCRENIHRSDIHHEKPGGAIQSHDFVSALRSSHRRNCPVSVKQSKSHETVVKTSGTRLPPRNLPQHFITTVKTAASRLLSALPLTPPPVSPAVALDNLSLFSTHPHYRMRRLPYK